MLSGALWLLEAAITTHRNTVLIHFSKCVGLGSPTADSEIRNVSTSSLVERGY